MKVIIKFLVLTVILCSAFFGWYYFHEQSFHDLTTPYLAKKWVKAELNDPNSAIFRNTKGYCGEVNSKNKMGGYNGFVRYVAIHEGLVSFEGETYSDFDESWRISCELTLKEWEVEFCKENPEAVFC
ncbi:hypothetical protein [Arsukibacterium sp.]|uniref:hypothetical protein n=1 Tax=Arsukibacterium sp. TaxID=1977258 RepID=UPI00299D34DD|nr:hypothetical protein [Arsukibacterium sp.]MDX1538823.1 hypothetical protein [Arsukibacterium sp.]